MEKLWKARALPFSLLITAGFGAGFFVILFLDGGVTAQGFLFLMLAASVTAGVGYFGTFGRNRLTITTADVAPPGKPIPLTGPRTLSISWSDVTAIEETRQLITGREGVSYMFTIRTANGRRYPFRSLYVAWLTESTGEMRRVYEMMNAIAKAFERHRLETLNGDPELMTRLTEIQDASFPELDLFSRTLASKLAMAIGGLIWLVGLTLLILAGNGQNPVVIPLLWIVGGLIFLLGLSTKRAFPDWGKRSPSARS